MSLWVLEGVTVTRSISPAAIRSVTGIKNPPLPSATAFGSFPAARRLRMEASDTQHA